MPVTPKCGITLLLWEVLFLKRSKRGCDMVRQVEPASGDALAACSSVNQARQVMLQPGDGQGRTLFLFLGHDGHGLKAAC